MRMQAAFERFTFVIEQIEKSEGLQDFTEVRWAHEA